MLEVKTAQENRLFPRLLTKLGLLVLIAVAGITFWSASNFSSARSWNRHSQSVIQEIRTLRLAIESARANLQSYYILAEPAILDRYAKSKTDIEHSVAELQALIVDNDTQLKRLREVALALQQRMVTYNSLLSMIKNGNSNSATTLIQDDIIRASIDDVKINLDHLEDEEKYLSKVRTERTESELRFTTFSVIAGVLLSFILFLTASTLLLKEIQLRSKAEKELQMANKRSNEASDLKSTFLANMSHEIRTPLNGIIGMAKLLEHTPLNTKQRDYIDTIKISSNSLLALINEILDLSKIESGKFQLEEINFELASLMKSAVSIVDFSAKAKNLNIVTEISPDVPDFLLGDPLRIRQVLLNLLNNAIKFSEQGNIKVRVSRKKVDDLTKIVLLFEIIDQGVGFDPETKARLFQTFSQGDQSTSRRYGGTGLGLAISKQIVQMMKGNIDVESVKDVGSRFYFDVNLRLPKQDMPVQAVSSIKNIRDLQGYVLIAEDNRVNQKVAIEMLGLLGCSSRVVENGKQALEALRNEDFDLVLMDAQMPVMDGYEATRSIRNGFAGEGNRNIPILATTANAIKGDIEQCLESGMNDYISKPIAFNDLAIKVEKWLGRGKNILDDSSLMKIRAQEDARGKRFLNEIVDIFSQDAPESLRKMRALLAEKNFDGLPAIAHNLKSSAALLGALRLKEITERIESSKQDNASEQQLINLVDSLEKELQLVLEDLVRKTKQEPPPPTL